MRKHRAEPCGNAPFQDCHGFLWSPYTGSDAQWSGEMQATLYAKGASTHSWRPEVPYILFQTDEFGMCGNFDTPLPHLMKRVHHMMGGIALLLHGELSLGVLQELHNHGDDPKLLYPPLPQDKQVMASRTWIASMHRCHTWTPPMWCRASKSQGRAGSSLGRIRGGPSTCLRPVS